MAAAAQTFALPFARGDGRFLAKAPMTPRITVAYSSLRYFLEKASVSAVIVEYISAIALGIFSDLVTASLGISTRSNSYRTHPRSQGRPSLVPLGQTAA